MALYAEIQITRLLSASVILPRFVSCLKNTCFLHDTFEIRLREICMGEDGNNIHVTAPLLSLKGCLTSWGSQVGLSRCRRAGVERTEWMGTDTYRARQILEYALSMQIGCRSARLACGDLSFWLFSADTQFICLWYFLVSPGRGFSVPGCSSRVPREPGLGHLVPRKAVCKRTLSAPASCWYSRGWC